MRQSILFPKTKKSVPKGAESINHQLLVRAGFMDQLMVGSWTLLPLGWRVVSKISDVIREELVKIDAQEILMPLMHPRTIWDETGRWDKADEIMYKLTDSRGKDFALSFTHEEIVLDLLRKHINSYTDLPVAIYHFSTKFRNELRAKSGILRGREFLMKDLYSAHTTKKDLDKYYFKVIAAYKDIFSRLGFKALVTEAGGGVFTAENTHELQVLADGGEDTIYYCSKCDWSENDEIFKGKAGDKCPDCSGKVKSGKSIEVGNVFRFGTGYSEKMKTNFIDRDGKSKPMFFGSYGIGTSRAMGAWVEVSHDDKGIIWSKAMSPFDVHLIELPGGKGKEVYGKLTDAGLDVLWDDRDVSVGQKFVESDLIGIPMRVTTSQKTGEDVELKSRKETRSNNYSLEEALKQIRNI